ncbi:TetR/AcrR family transcriptional regulator [Rhodoplanes sp. Z2-YC6860]|uniref:TetR/AcrR family transcriptional regulator n=1 Tax=Rhodoplanes sp. Z2-YC6860 TaxID=674703 RepID=UPI00078EDBB5|nr:TetR/AcrR family transcriptional regulator [Rhodoplanes sp. Z2-YC6860]AMN39628.1 TetR family transcription factor [Rhodoplanes sp. Z2-YC6860]
MEKGRVSRAHAREGLDTATPARILERAIELFAERGFSDVTVRDIAEHAQANPAAISYYFGAKDQLIRQAIKAVVAPLNEKRLAALSAVEAQKRFGVADVVRAMVIPTVEACMKSTGPERHYARVLVLSFALRERFIDEAMSEQTDRVALRFVEAMGRAAPGQARARLFWHFDFMIGAIMHILLDASRGHRLRRLSDGAADTGRADAITSELVDFLTAGMATVSKVGSKRSR